MATFEIRRTQPREIATFAISFSGTERALERRAVDNILKQYGTKQIFKLIHEELNTLARDSFSEIKVKVELVAVRAGSLEIIVSIVRTVVELAVIGMEINKYHGDIEKAVKVFVAKVQEKKHDMRKKVLNYLIGKLKEPGPINETGPVIKA